MIGLFCLYLYSGKIDDYQIMKDLSDFNTEIRAEEIKGESFLVLRNVTKKFQADKILEHHEGIALVTEGVILNRTEIEEKNEKALSRSLIEHYKNGTLSNAMKELRGSFSGIIVDVETQKVTVFLDQLATKTLFYYQFKDGVVIASEVRSIANFCKMNGLPISLSMVGAYSMLTYGYMYLNNTLVKEIKRLREGSIYCFRKDEINVERYHEFSSIDEAKAEISDDVAIDEINTLFRRGLGLAIDKNKEYKYLDPIPLSAGMDCRMTAFVYHDLQDNPALNFTYSETGEYDFSVPSRMAHDLGNKWLFKSLDHGLDLYNIDESVKIADGLVYYAWPAQLMDFLRYANTREWGIIHTGVLGDVVIDSFVKVGASRKYKLGDGAFSIKLIDKLKKYVPEPVFDYEHGMLSNRGINGACLGYSLTFRHFTEDISPFLFIDLFDYCLSLPLNKRQRHRLYYAWVRKYYPEALEYKHNGISPKGKIEVSLKGKTYRIRAIPDILKNKIRKKLNPNYGMNPLDGWYSENKKLKMTMDNYFYTNVRCLERWNELYSDVNDLYTTGNTKEKIQAISLVGSIKMFFTEGAE